MRRFVHNFEDNPDVQFKFHRYAMYVWLLNAVVWSACFLFFPAAWDRAGLFVTLMLSLYANWDTDYDAMSASGAWREAKRLGEPRVAGCEEPPPPSGAVVR